MPRLDSLFKMMLEKDASDLFISSGAPPAYKIHGEVKPAAAASESLTPAICRQLIFELLSEDQRHQFEADNDLDFAYEIPGLARYRGNMFMQRRGISAVFRAIPSTIKSLEDLDLPEVVGKMARINRGLILVTGATGSGKSTTLAAMIDVRNRERAEHILTLEDPLEFVHENKKSIVHQRQIGDHTHSFASSLRAALREAPDVILVGEMRDLETISLAITAAETGHLVYGTLHTSSAAKTVDRIIDAFPAAQQAQIRTMLSESLEAVIAQTLLKKKGGGGRVAACEVLVGVPAVRNLIREGKLHQIPSMMQTGQRSGMQTLDMGLADLVKRGLVEQSALPPRPATGVAA